MNKKFFKKLYIVFIINLLILLSCTCSVFADNFYTNFVNSILNFVQDPLGKTQDDIKYLVYQTFNSVGFLIDETGITLDKIKNAIHLTDNNFDNSTADEDDIANWISQNISTVSGNVVYGDQYNSFIKNYNNGLVNYHDGYAFDIDLISNSFTNEQKAFISEKQKSGYLIIKPSKYISTGSGNSDVFIQYLPFSSNVYLHGTDYSGNYNVVYYCNGLSYSLTDNQLISLGLKVYNGNLQDITANTSGFNPGAYLRMNDSYSSWVNSGYVHYVSKGTLKLRFYSVLDTTIGTSNPYINNTYYNNSVWDNFVDNSSGDYTVSNQNINTVSYGDTVNYINEYNNTNNNYPDNSVVNTWIENTNTENNSNNDNGGGDSGGGSGGDDNGGGSSGDIFGWLKQIGSALGSLIKGLGEFLAEVIEGLSEAISELLSSISSLLQSLTQDLPSQFFDFLGALFSWMPAEWTTLLSYSLIAMIIWGIVKMIRG